MSTTRNSKVIKASQEILYEAFTNPESLQAWLAPGNMYGRIHNFNLAVGGGYIMSLYYPSSEKEARGKTSEKEDRFIAKFLELTPPKKIVQLINFESDLQDFSGDMIMEVILEAQDQGTKVTIIFNNIPPGIRPEDNEEGTRESLEKLARFVIEH